MLDSSSWHGSIVMLRRAMAWLGPLTPVPWLAHLAYGILPRVHLLADWFAMQRFCHVRMDERIAVRSKVWFVLAGTDIHASWT